jgi:DNA-binding PadR family transcriptional regulator
MHRVHKIPTRLSASQRLILDLLIHGGEQYGLQMVAQSNGQIARGSIYVLLGRMEDQGLVESRQEDRAPGASGIPRRLYRATGLGQRVLRAWQQYESMTRHELVPGMA